MGTTGAAVSDYGWHSTEPTCAAAYLLGPIVAELRRLQAHRVLDLELACQQPVTLDEAGGGHLRARK